MLSPFFDRRFLNVSLNERNRLDLGLNRIRDKGALAIAQAINAASPLVEIGLKLNFIKDQGALALAK